MRDDYLLRSPTVKLELSLETPVLEIVKTMESYTGHSVSEITNTALKRFIVHHKDFLPSPPSEPEIGVEAR